MNGNANDKLDLLGGSRAISDFTGLKVHQIVYLIRSKQMPAFKIGRTLCASRAALTAWAAEQQAKSTP